MAAPKYVPTPPIQTKFYQSALRKGSSRWISERPAEQKHASRQNLVGSQGPDQDALKSFDSFRMSSLAMKKMNDEGCCDCRIKTGFAIQSRSLPMTLKQDFAYDYFDPEPASDLVKFRIKISKSKCFTTIMQRSIADIIPAEKLKQGLRN